MIDHYLAESEAASLYRDGHLVNNRDLTCGPDQMFFGVCAIIRGEARFLVEWIEFHLMMGVQHFIIYDNGLEPETKKILMRYEALKQVTRIPWPNIEPAALRRADNDGSRVPHWRRERLQLVAYGDCVRRYAGQFDWLLKIDLDEFIFPVSEQYTSVHDVLRTLERNKFLSLRVPLLQFGSSGYHKSPEGLVIENYIRCEREISRSTKTIGNTDMIATDCSVKIHTYRYRALKILQGWVAGSPREMHRRVTGAILRINHYRTKSREDHLLKGKVNAQGYLAGKETLERFNELESNHNESENYDIQRFLQQLRVREKMGFLRHRN